MMGLELIRIEKVIDTNYNENNYTKFTIDNF